MFSLSCNYFCMSLFILLLGDQDQVKVRSVSTKMYPLLSISIVSEVSSSVTLGTMYRAEAPPSVSASRMGHGLA